MCTFVTLFQERINCKPFANPFFIASVPVGIMAYILKEPTFKYVMQLSKLLSDMNLTVVFF